MTGEIVAHDPCPVCENQDMCNICELTLRRSGAINDHRTDERDYFLKALSDLKREIHDKAVYPETRSVKPYISLKVVDAIIINKMEEIKNEK